MKITYDLLDIKFRKYNREYFNSELPVPRFTIINSYYPFAEFRCNKPIGNRRIQKAEIRFAAYIDFSESQFRDILVHEMIHYYLVYKNIDRTFKHNKKFKEMINCFNKKYELNMQVKGNIWKYKRQKNAPRFGWFLAHII